MNMFKSNGGFTLVELIVVIAILAILAGVAVPAYTGYIAKAQTAADLQLLSTVNTAVQGLAAGEGATVSSIKVEKNGTITIDTDPDDKVVTAEVAELIGGALKETDFSDKFVEANWTSDTGEWAVKTTNASNDASGN